MTKKNDKPKTSKTKLKAKQLKLPSVDCHYYFKKYPVKEQGGKV